MNPGTELDLFGCRLDGINLVEASAGTGKTWNLCGLYLRLLLERALEVRQLLVLTFTNAATAELRDRIRSRLAETLAELRGQRAASGDPFVADLLQHLRGQGLHDDDMGKRLDLALQSFDDASIFTLHGFCQRALADTPFSARMPMQVELLQDDSLLRDEVVHDFWRRRVASDRLDPVLAAHLVRRGDTPQRLDALLSRQLQKPLALNRWPAGIEAPAQIHLERLRGHLRAAQQGWRADREGIVQTLMRGLPQLNGNVYKRASVEAGALEWDAWLAIDDPLLLLGNEAGNAAHFGRTRLQLRTRKEGTTPRHAFFDVAQDLLDGLASLGRTLALQRLRLWRDGLDEGGRALRETKRQRHGIAFDDMLFNLHERLHDSCGPALAALLRQRFPAALVDEFQDTDPLQFGVLRSIYGDGRSPLFLLGDPKQAIYSFRNADLQTYLQARRLAGAQTSLRANQRACRPLLQALNALFSANPEAFIQPGLDFQPAHFGDKQRPAFDDRSAPRAALQLWRLPERDRDGLPFRFQAARQAAVDACAAEISRLLAAAQRGQVQHDGRPLGGGDIAVLVRSHRQGLQMRRALAALGVGCVELSQARVLDSVDAEELERVLAAIAEPARIRTLKAALATECMGLDAGAIDALASDPQALPTVLQSFAAHRQVWLHQGVATMLRGWLTQEQVAERLLRRSDGARRLTNLLHLTELLHEASREFRSPEALLHWLRAERSGHRADDSLQLRLESDQDLVQIVTVHKAKGLEYPIVFCPLLWDEIQLRSNGIDGIEWHDDEGRSVIDFRAGLDDDFDVKAVKARRQSEADAESLRLIYVALTRAVQRCYLVIGCPAKKAQGGYSHKAGQRNLLNWLVAGSGHAAARWRTAPPAVALLDAAWAGLASRQAPHIVLGDLPAAEGMVLPAAGAEGASMDNDALAALPAPTLRPPWRIGSYSSLVHGTLHDQAAIDHDLRASLSADDETMPISAQAPAADDILDFPRGPAAGECLHTLFELADFADAGQWPSAVQAALHRHRAALPAEPAPGAHRRMLLQLLADVTTTELPLGDGRAMQLAQLPAARRIVEMEFHLPTHRLTAAAMNALLASFGLPCPPLGFRSLQGFLKGFIDLVFEHQGRWFVLDWKSNHLGTTAADYAARPLEDMMARHGYQLQALLYTVALDRLLRQRLPDYRFETHVGGALYLFVRGVRPGWRSANGRPAGWFLQAPNRPLVDTLSALLDGTRVAS